MTYPNHPDFIAYYDNEIQEAKKDVGIYGIVEKSIPSFTSRYYRASL